MLETVEKFYEETQSACSAAALKAVLDSWIRNLGVDHFAYLALRIPRPDTVTQSFPFFISNYPSKWIEVYVKNSYHLRDPVITFGRLQRQPFSWGCKKVVIGQSAEERRVLDHAKEFGIVSGLTAPVFGPSDEFGLFTVASTATASPLDNIERSLEHMVTLAALRTHSIAVERIMCDVQERPPMLTSREREVLLWAARGKTGWETASILHRSPATVHFHIRRATEKLNATNRCQAVANATKLRLLD